jgi:hypothetical protein
MHGSNEKCIKICDCKTRREETIAKSRHRCEDNTATYLKEIVWKGVEMNNLPQEESLEHRIEMLGWESAAGMIR